MKLRTSYFNGAVLKKDITRFAPLWGLYTVFTVLFVLLTAAADPEPARFANNASDIMSLMGPVNFFYAGLCALLLFGDLFNSRLCNALHAMPLRREGWFLTHTAAGLLMCVVPNTLGALLAAAILGEYCYLAFLWLGIVVLEFLFFFGVGVFSAMCVGNKLGMAAVYCLINFFAVLAGLLIDCFYAPVFYGMVFDMDAYSSLSPYVRFIDSQFVLTEFDNMKDITRFLGFVPEDWQYLWVAAAVGAVTLLAAALLYKKRKLESAGDFIVLKPVAHVFLVLYSLSAGALLFVLSDLGIVFLPVGIAIGFFTGRMILERKVNVFRGKSFLAFGALIGAFIVTILLTVWDPLGFTRYVPEPQQIKNVTISPYSGQYYRQHNNVLLEEQADVDAIVDIHRDLAYNRSYSTELPLYIRYELTDGTVVEREYNLETESENGQKLRYIFSREDVVLKGCDVQSILEDATRIEFNSMDGSLPFVAFIPEGEDVDDFVLAEKYGYYGGYDPKILYMNGSFANSEVAKGLMEAIVADCQAGNMAQQTQFHRDYEQLGWLIIECAQSKYEYRYIEIRIYDDSANTLAYIKALAES